MCCCSRCTGLCWVLLTHKTPWICIVFALVQILHAHVQSHNPSDFSMSSIFIFWLEYSGIVYFSGTVWAAVRWSGRRRVKKGQGDGKGNGRSVSTGEEVSEKCRKSEYTGEGVTWWEMVKRVGEKVEKQRLQWCTKPSWHPRHVCASVIVKRVKTRSISSSHTTQTIWLCLTERIFSGLGGQRELLS